MAEPVVLDDLVVRPTDTLATAFHRLRAAGRGLVLVVDGDGLVGTLTDGAVRRAALDRPSLDVPVGDVVSRRPVVLDAGAGDDEVRGLLASARLPAVPVVEGGRLVGLRTADEFDGLRGPAPSPW